MIRWNGKQYVPAGVKPLMNRKRGANVPGMPKTRWIASWVGGETELECDFTYEILVTPTPTPTSSITPTPSITPTLTPTPTPSSSAPSIDPDAAAYLADVVASGGTTNPTIEAAVDTLFTSLKSNGLYNKMIAMYPYVGATAASHAINATLDKTFDITWNGGLTHDVSGTTGNGSNGYGNTHITNDVCFSANSKNISFGYYQNSLFTPIKNESPIGAMNSNYNWVQVYNDATNSNWRVGAFLSPGVYVHSGDTSGNYIGSRTGTTGEVVYRNGVQIITKAGDDGNPTPNTPEWYVLNMNNGGTPFSGYYSKQRFSFHFACEGLSNSEITTLDGIINTFQTSLGRNTY